MALTRNAVHRTAEIWVNESNIPNDRYFFIDYIHRIVGIDSLVAIGTTNRRGYYQITFSTFKKAQKFVDAGDFNINGYQCTTYMLRDKQTLAKIHSLPFAVEDDYVIQLIKKKYGLTVSAFTREKYRSPDLKHVYTNVRYVTFVCEDDTRIPRTFEYKNNGVMGNAQIFVKDQPLRCFQCTSVEHKRRECPQNKAKFSSTSTTSSDELTTHLTFHKTVEILCHRYLTTRFLKIRSIPTEKMVYTQ